MAVFKKWIQGEKIQLHIWLIIRFRVALKMWEARDQGCAKEKNFYQENLVENGGGKGCWRNKLLPAVSGGGSLLIEDSGPWSHYPPLTRPWSDKHSKNCADWTRINLFLLDSFFEYGHENYFFFGRTSPRCHRSFSDFTEAASVPTP